jgi:hypothetical protein
LRKRRWPWTSPGGKRKLVQITSPQLENQKSLAIDGITDLDTGSNSTVHLQPSMDAISEIKIHSNYQAEFGCATLSS